MSISRYFGISVLALAWAPHLAFSVPQGVLRISWDTSSPQVAIHGPGGNLMMLAAPLEATGGSWLPAAADAPIGFDKTDYFTFCTDAGARIQSSATYAARSFAELSAFSNPGVSPPWRTDAHGSFLSAIEGAEYLYVHNYASVFPVIAGHTTVESVQAAGLQLAIWNALYDNDRNIFSGTFYADQALGDAADAVRNAAQGFLDSLPSDGSPLLQSLASTWLDPRLPENGYPGDLRPTQGLLYFVDPVPEAATTFLLLGLGLGGLGLFSARLPKPSSCQ